MNNLSASAPDIDELLDSLHAMLPGIVFKPGAAFSWSPAHNTVTYRQNNLKAGTYAAMWALLHEASHALLKHTNYHSDLDLLHKEVAAWQKAKELAGVYAIKIDDEHIQNCLDTYRDWLHRRSTCPRCRIVSLQTSSCEYACHNCHATWQVSLSRMCRPYRISKPQIKKPSKATTRTAFC